MMTSASVTLLVVVFSAGRWLATIFATWMSVCSGSVQQQQQHYCLCTSSAAPLKRGTCASSVLRSPMPLQQQQQQQQHGAPGAVWDIVSAGWAFFVRSN
jgi:uncharacterized lipoprotein YmbA